MDLGFFVKDHRKDTFRKGGARWLRLSPARLSILTFAIVIFMGTVLLMLPFAVNHERLAFVDALFTATSAVCVTGLVVVDTGTAFSVFGQMVILVLIQVGGLGIMAFSTLFLLMARRRPSLQGRFMVQDSFTQGGEHSFPSILYDVVLFTLSIEAVGAALLFLPMLSGRDAGEAIYLSVFHSVSAFCNAGFSLFSDSFMAYGEDWTLNLVICFLIVSGGIGFLVLSELRRKFPLNRRRWTRLSLHTKMVLTSTSILILLGTILVAGMEWKNTLASMTLPGKFLASLFQSVTARTAGFNTLAIGDMANETLFAIIILMFIGASPGSCGGGIKTTTLASLVSMALSRIRGYRGPRIFYRTIAPESTGKAVSVVMVSLLVVVLGTLILLMTELGDVPHTMSRGYFLELLFEVVSAFGTVGLSTGVTPNLSTAGKLVITAVMLVGRLGPLVVALAVSRERSSEYAYAQENIMIG